MSQEYSKRKRLRLRHILGERARRTALWLAPALLSPILSTAVVTDNAHGQVPAATTASAGTQSSVNPAFVMGWIEYSVQAKDKATSSKAFAEALRGRKILAQTNGQKDPAIESRLGQAQKVLVSRGITTKDIQNAIPSLGALMPAPVVTASAFPALPGAVQPASATSTTSKPTPAMPALPAPNNPAVGAPVSPGAFLPPANQPTTQQVSTSTNQQLQVPSPEGTMSSGDDLYRSGLELLAAGNRDEALNAFRQAWKYRAEMDPALRNQLQDKLSAMQAVNIGNTAENVYASPMSQISEEERAMAQRMMSEVTGEIAGAEANREAEPMVVRDRLQTLRTRVSQANLDGQTRKQLLTIVDRAITSHQIYMTQNEATIDQNMRNQQVLNQRELEAERRAKTDQQIASLVETYNDLMKKGDFFEAEVVAKEVGVLDRKSTISKLLIANARNARRIGEYEAIKEMKEDKFVDNMLTVDEAAIPFDDRQPLLFGEVERWEQLTKRRTENLVPESERGMTLAERAIYEKLKQPVLVDFKGQPLSEVMRVLADMTGVLIHIDQAGLAMEGLTSDMPVTLSLPSQISLQSALRLVLNTQNLDFQVRNEVLMITSARNTADANVQRTYNVKDLVIPIPNFVTDYNSGMAGALRQAYEASGRGLFAQTMGSNVVGETQLNQNMFANASINPNSGALGQINNIAGGNLPNAIGGGFGLGGGAVQGPVMGNPLLGSAPLSMGSPGAIGGGAAMADFDTLINLIQQTIDPDSWLAAGGTSTILQYPSNLSIVVSAPQTTQEKIADLLESLRSLQDLQVTIEVKFITLNDNFFERLGVDFDLRIDDNVRELPLDDSGNTTTVGLNAGFQPGQPIPFTADFDVALTQDSFTSAIPAFGGFDPAAGASLGFAILSDLEMFFFMNAAQGDQRTNVLQAPRVTMFDGQFASIVDNVQRPFVTSLIPVVADFAVAQQPVIVVLAEGTNLNVQATVSPDKRFVRLTLNPSFSQINNVDTFTFQGSQTTDVTTNVLDGAGNLTGATDTNNTVITGTTVQQPSFATTSISTTVSVPDGGTILLGGIKRMREGRLERGVPILSKIPYVNRLFKNTSIGRETSTLMMTVTPRIIIQEEEEEFVLGGNP